MFGKYLLLAGLLFCSTATFSQEDDNIPTYKGTISGHVYDETDKPVMDAEVFIYKPDNVAIVGSANTGDDSTNTGGFITNRIDTGMYNVQLKYEGYRRLIVNNVPVHLDKTSELRLKLSPEAPEATDNIVVDYKMVAVIRKEEPRLPVKKGRNKK
jgi:hypothetical protein